MCNIDGFETFQSMSYFYGFHYLYKHRNFQTVNISLFFPFPVDEIRKI